MSFRFLSLCCIIPAKYVEATNKYLEAAMNARIIGSGTETMDPNLYDPLKYSSFHAFANDLIALMPMDELHLTSSVFVGPACSTQVRYINTEDYEGGFDGAAVADMLMLTSIEPDYRNWTPSFLWTTVRRTQSLCSN
ncbi:hypothetical protein V6N13_144745 [Hibiscus sabdariffa]